MVDAEVGLSAASVHCRESPGLVVCLEDQWLRPCSIPYLDNPNPYRFINIFRTSARRICAVFSSLAESAPDSSARASCRTRVVPAQDHRFVNMCTSYFPRSVQYGLADITVALYVWIFAESICSVRPTEASAPPVCLHQYEHAPGVSWDLVSSDTVVIIGI